MGSRAIYEKAVGLLARCKAGRLAIFASLTVQKCRAVVVEFKIGEG